MGLFVGALVRSDRRLERPDLQINMFAWAIRIAHGTASSPAVLRVQPGARCICGPDGRGTVRLKSPDPLAAPEIRFNFLKAATTTRR